MTNFSQNFVTLTEFIMMAIQFESESAEFYRNMQPQVPSGTARELLILLEKEKLKHQKALLEIHFNANAKEILRFPPSFLFSLPTISSEHPTPHEIIKVAIERERASAKIYSNAAAMVSGNFKEFLQSLANFERQHEERLLSLQILI